MAEHTGEQLALIRRQVRPTRQTRHDPAPELPVARVAVDLPLAHLDRPFDYLVSAKQHDTCVPGCRVKVRFAGQDLDGFVLDRLAESEHEGRLMPLRRVVSAEPVLAPDVAALARLVADRYAGTMADVLRLAVPPRHARVENETPRPSGPEVPAEPVDPAEPVSTPADPWPSYTAGTAFCDALRRGGNPRAVWTALPGHDWAHALAVAAAATLAGGRGGLLIVPDQRDVARLDAACAQVLGSGRHLTLTADLGPAERYRRFLAVRRGQVRCVVGTRAAAFAPVRDLGLVACWDDGDDLHAEPRAPYPHVREVLAFRSHQVGAAALIGGFACTAESAQLLDSGWARSLTADRSVVRAAAPRVQAVGETDAELARDPAARAVRLPHKAFEVARSALETGPVLIQVPRAGYLPALACQSCRQAARCTECFGPLQITGERRLAACAWCGRVAASWQCPSCGGRAFRAPVVGFRRTAEELGRAFPRVPVRTSGGQRVLDEVGEEPALIVSTPGAEPVATAGYAAGLLLDSWLALGRADLRAGEEALRRWFGAAALVRPGSAGGQVVVVGDPGLVTVQALVRWSPLGFAERELGERRAAGFPPAVRMATVEGPAGAINELLELLRVVGLPPDCAVLGPVPLPPSGQAAHSTPDATDDTEDARIILRAPRAQGAALAAGLKAAQAIRTTRKSPGSTRVRVDPHAFG